jgi:hypothetical protein
MGSLRGDVHFDSPQIDAVVRRISLRRLNLGAVPTGRGTHSGVHGVPGVSQAAGGEGAEAARRAGNHDDLLHKMLLFEFED